MEIIEKLLSNQELLNNLIKETAAYRMLRIDKDDPDVADLDIAHFTLNDGYVHVQNLSQFLGQFLKAIITNEDFLTGQECERECSQKI